MLTLSATALLQSTMAAVFNKHFPSDETDCRLEKVLLVSQADRKTCKKLETFFKTLRFLK